MTPREPRNGGEAAARSSGMPRALTATVPAERYADRWRSAGYVQKMNARSTPQ